MLGSAGEGNDQWEEFDDSKTIWVGIVCGVAMGLLTLLTVIPLIRYRVKAQQRKLEQCVPCRGQGMWSDQALQCRHQCMGTDMPVPVADAVAACSGQQSQCPCPAWTCCCPASRRAALSLDVKRQRERSHQLSGAGSKGSWEARTQQTLGTLLARSWQVGAVRLAGLHGDPGLAESLSAGRASCMWLCCLLLSLVRLCLMV